MTIALAAMPEGVGFWMELAALLVVAIGITVMVYGGVGLIVKADDLGLLMARSGRLRGRRGRAGLIVRGMPGLHEDPHDRGHRRDALGRRAPSSSMARRSLAGMRPRR